MFLSIQPVHPFGGRTRICGNGCCFAGCPKYGKPLYIELNTDAQKNTAGIAVPTVSFVSVAEIAVSVSRFTFVAGEPAPELFFFTQEKNSISGAICKE